ncbi:MAG: sulfotransferase [Planctomycetota bacterium]
MDKTAATIATAAAAEGERSLRDAPIFVVGSPRSGTHLLRFCLSQHPRIYICPETAFFFQVYGNRKLIPESTISENVEKLFNKLYRSGDPTMREFDYLREELTARVANEVTTYSQFAETVLAAFAAAKGKERWGEKTPLHSLYLQQIFELFPSSRVLMLNRSPKNVIASYVKSSHLPNDFYKGAAECYLCYTAGRRFADKIHQVSYDDLTCQPEQTLRAICDYIGEEFDPRMLSPGMVDSSYNNEAMKFSSDIGILPENPDKWKAVLTDHQAEFVDYLFGEGSTSFSPRYLFDLLKFSRTKLRHAISAYKNSLGYENIVRYRRGIW